MASRKVGKVVKIVLILVKVLLFLFFLPIFPPLLTYCYPAIMNMPIFGPIKMAQRKWDVNEHNLTGYTFYVPSEKSMVPIWHVYPKPNGKDSVKDAQNALQINTTKVVFYAHGNSQPRAHKARISIIRKYVNRGYHVFMHEYQGFGETGGHASGFTAIGDTKVALRWLMEKVADPKQIMVHSFSLGTAITVSAFTEDRYLLNVRCLILEAPLFSIDEMFGERLTANLFFGKWIPLPLYKATTSMVQEKFGSMFDTSAAFEKWKVTDFPLLHMHGKGDKHIKFKQAEQLNQQLGKKMKNYFFLKGGNNIKHYFALDMNVERLFDLFYDASHSNTTDFSAVKKEVAKLSDK